MLGLGKLDKNDKLVLLLGFLVTIKIRIVGMFSGAELVLMAMLLFQNNSQYKSNKYVKRLWILAIFWMIGTIVSNMYNNVAQLDFIKGVFFLVVLILIIPPIYKLLYEKPERIALFFLSYGLGQLLAPYTTTDADLAKGLETEVYVFYGILAFISGISYVLYVKGYRKLSVLARYTIAIIGLFNEARNPFLTGTIAFLLIWIMSKQSEGEIASVMSRYKRKVPRYFMIAMIAAFAADSIYEPLAAKGTLGDAAQEKYYKQKRNGVSTLEGGRMETFMGIQLICDNPIMGYGSYAKDRNDNFHYKYANEHKLEYSAWILPTDRYLPSHSHIVGAWMENGILGGVFWLYVLYVFWKVFSSGCIMCEPRLLCLLMFQSCTFAWDVCFSPFGDRTFTMFFIITLFIIYDRAKKGHYQSGQVKRLRI